MKLYQKKWWRNIFKASPRKKLDSEKDIQAVIEFLEEVKYDVNNLLPQLKQLWELEKERKVASSGIVHVNIDTQVKILDQVLERFEFFQSDVAITGIRVKHISENLVQEARRQGMKDLAIQKENDPRWKF